MKFTYAVDIEPGSVAEALVRQQKTERGADLRLEEGDGWTLAKYTAPDGEVDYEAYKAVQNLGNAAKLDWIFAAEPVIRFIAADAQKQLNKVRRVLCHGTRNGAEIRWFKDALPKAEVLGTDIADTATQFPNTIQWDFHQFREDWANRWDVIYSNSWDHAMDPLRMFASWSKSLRRGGLMYLEHSDLQLKVNGLDTFAATPVSLIEFALKGSSGSLRPLPPLSAQGRTLLRFVRDR